MRVTLRAIGMAVLSAVAGIAQDSPDTAKPAAQVGEILAEMSKPKIDFDRFALLEAKLQTMPVIDVIPALVGSPHTQMPTGPIYNGGLARMEHDYPPRWRLFHSLRRVNVKLRRTAPIAVLKQALLRAHHGSDAAEVELRLYFDCWSRADPKHIVAAARKVMHDDKRVMSMRVLGARALLQFTHAKSYEEVCNFACKNSVQGDVIGDFIRLFPHRRTAHGAGMLRVLRIPHREPDPRLVAYAFEAIVAAKKAKHGDSVIAAVEVRRAGELVGLSFAPNVSKPKSKKLTTEQSAEATVDNALRWWGEHQKTK